MNFQWLKRLNRKNIATILHGFAVIQIIIFLVAMLPSDLHQGRDFPEEHQQGERNRHFEDGRPRSEYHEAISVSGDATLIYLALCLTMTPLYIIWGIRGGLALRKMTGLYAFLFGILHTIAYLADHQFTVLSLFDEIYIIAGFIAVLIMVPLAITSNRWSMKRLGKNWKRLQRMIYIATIFTAIHLVLIPADIVPVVYMFILLMVRIPPIRHYLVQRRQNKSKLHPRLAAV
jgi:sulfoxide reductase heme-binding subunit YedZ